MPLGHWLRGSISMPARCRRRPAAASAASGTSVLNHGPAHRSQRPHAVAVSSSSAVCKNAIRHPVVAS